MYASGLLHKKKSSKSSKRRSGGGNACCPVIRIKCSWPKGRGAKAAEPQGLMARLKAFKAAKATMVSAASSAAGPKGSLGGAKLFGGWKGIIPGHTAAALETAARQAKNCTVMVGKRTYKGMTAAQATRKVGAAVREQKAKRCMPLVKRSGR